MELFQKKSLPNTGHKGWKRNFQNMFLLLSSSRSRVGVFGDLFLASSARSMTLILKINAKQVLFSRDFNFFFFLFQVTSSLKTSF